MTETPLPIRFGDDGLIPVVIADANGGAVLMVAFMNATAFAVTRETGFVHFWSRSRQKLWKKGETSGHVQRVERIAVNCELNSLLIEVTQTGAVCHDGYPTCFYRTLEPDNSLTVIGERQFDPAAVYGATSETVEVISLWWHAYEWLRDHDLTDDSRTSRVLRRPPVDARERIADELKELAGVLDGTHRHNSLESDIRLEASQVYYWLAVQSVGNHLTLADVAPSTALDTPSVAVDGHDSLAHVLRDDAQIWTHRVSSTSLRDRIRRSLTLVAAACVQAGLSPYAPISSDVDELRTRPYLQEYFATQPSGVMT